MPTHPRSTGLGAILNSLAIRLMILSMVVGIASCGSGPAEPRPLGASPPSRAAGAELQDTFHLRPDGDDTLDGRSYETAWANFQRAFNALQRPSVLLVHPGLYEQGDLGLYAGKPCVEICALGEVLLCKPEAASRILTVYSDNGCLLRGMVLEGTGDGPLLLFRGRQARVEGCIFRGPDAGRCLYVENGDSCALRNSSFGQADHMLEATAVELLGSEGSVVEDCDFFVRDATCILATRSPGLRIVGNCFGGRASQPRPLELGGRYAVRLWDGDAAEVRGNRFTLRSGSSIGVHHDQGDVTGLLIAENLLIHTESGDGYVIYVGSELPLDHDFLQPRIIDNRICLPTAVEDCTLHDLFVGYAVAPEVRGNFVEGGGYGIGIKGCDQARVSENEVRQCRRACIIDKAGYGCEFFDNVMVNSIGFSLGRVTDDLTSGRRIEHSWWHHNAYHFGVGMLVFEINSPCHPDSNDIRSDFNEFTGWGVDSLAYIDGGLLRSWEEMRQLYGWDLQSTLRVVELGRSKEQPSLAGQ